METKLVHALIVPRDTKHAMILARNLLIIVTDDWRENERFVVRFTRKMWFLKDYISEVQKGGFRDDYRKWF